MSAANPARGEAAIIVAGAARVLRPSFGRLVAAEAELGPLFKVVERAAGGDLSLKETAGLLWHSLKDQSGLTREALGEAIVEQGLSATAPILKTLIGQILRGR